MQNISYRTDLVNLLWRNKKMLGMREIIIGVVLLIIASLFGKNWFLKMYRDIRGIKKDMHKIDKETEVVKEDV